MKLLLLEETEFRGKTIKKGQKADIPEGAAFRLIANGKAQKISDDEVIEEPKQKKAGAKNAKNSKDKTDN